MVTFRGVMLASASDRNSAGSAVDGHCAMWAFHTLAALISTIAMKKLLFLLLVVAQCGSASAQRPEIVPGQLIVQLREGAAIGPVVAANATLDGKSTGLSHQQYLSPPMRIHLLSFDPQTDHNALLRQVFDHPAVTEAQFNHVIEFRETVPNDPQFNQQWQHQNTGANGGTAGADVDSPLAWDITTGGVTALGDTIVVCIVDDGTRYDHPDLVQNLWRNYNEIPDNSIDDDGNGYVDDYYGWNASNSTANVNTGSHGVNVAGMIGARGDNGVGVVGVNWNVKMMNVVNGSIGSGNSPNQANVIAAYTYPLIMRQLYHETGGQRGAFVVATNSSWGINNGNPNNAPLWCTFYDTLGAYGILNAGATANAQINVDVNGDLPTGCASDYMVSVTATNNQDVRTFSGYGLTTIDLGAPGESVRTTSGTNGYTTTDGTSFATPMVAGAIALLYSAPCPSLAAIAHADPQLAADLVRDYIIGGVDVVDDLVGFTVTGGRLNLKNALDLLLNDCQDAGCIGALNVTVGGITDVAATVNWTGLEDVLTFDVRYGVVGSDDTLNVAGVTSPFVLEDLSACTSYWVSFRSQCAEDSSGWSTDRLFRTDGCCEPPTGVAVTGPIETFVGLTWNPVLAAIGYDVHYRVQGTEVWDVLSTQSPMIVLSDLEPCTWYEVGVSTVCDTGATGFTDIITFRTSGCGDCIDITYCESEGVTTFEWIGSVSVGDFTNASGAASGGYTDFTDLSVDLHRGEDYDLTLVPDFANSSYREHFRIWVDLDRNGEFSPSERLFDDTDGATSTVIGTLTIPLDAELGSARMRVSMAYGAPFGGDYPQTPCATGQDGEVEDYCVNILEELEDTTGIRETAGSGIFGMDVFPVPANDVLQVRLRNAPAGGLSLTVMDMQGRIALRSSMPAADRLVVDISALRPGVYVIEALSQKGLEGRARFVVR
jgi:serine protease